MGHKMNIFNGKNLIFYAEQISNYREK